MSEVYYAVVRETTSFTPQDWVKGLACLTLLSFVYLLASRRG